MTLTQRAMAHNRATFLAELRTAASARYLHGDLAGQVEISRTIIELEAGIDIENDWTLPIARRFLLL